MAVLHRVGETEIFPVGKGVDDAEGELAALVADGMSPTRAGVLLDVSGETVSGWKRTKPEFDAKVEKGRALYVQKLVKRIDKAGETEWKAALALLERREPDEFGKVSTVKTVDPMEMERKRNASALELAESPLFHEFLRQEPAIEVAHGNLPPNFSRWGVSCGRDPMQRGGRESEKSENNAPMKKRANLKLLK